MLCFGRGENGLWGERSIASRSLDFLGPHLGPFVGAECVTSLLYIPERSRALLISPLFPNARLIHTVEVIGSNPIAPTIFNFIAYSHLGVGARFAPSRPQPDAAR